MAMNKQEQENIDRDQCTSSPTLTVEDHTNIVVFIREHELHMLKHTLSHKTLLRREHPSPAEAIAAILAYEHLPPHIRQATQTVANVLPLLEGRDAELSLKLKSTLDKLDGALGEAETIPDIIKVLSKFKKNGSGSDDEREEEAFGAGIGLAIAIAEDEATLVPPIYASVAKEDVKGAVKGVVVGAIVGGVAGSAAGGVGAAPGALTGAIVGGIAGAAGQSAAELAGQLWDYMWS